MEPIKKGTPTPETRPALGDFRDKLEYNEEEIIQNRLINGRPKGLIIHCGEAAAFPDIAQEIHPARKDREDTDGSVGIKGEGGQLGEERLKRIVGDPQKMGGGIQIVEADAVIGEKALEGVPDLVECGRRENGLIEQTLKNGQVVLVGWRAGHLLGWRIAVRNGVQKNWRDKTGRRLVPGGRHGNLIVFLTIAGS
jgi:hypothetical protein